MFYLQVASWSSTITQAYEDIKTGVKEQSSELKEQSSELKKDVKDLTAKVDASLKETFGIRIRSERIEREVDNLERRR